MSYLLRRYPNMIGSSQVDLINGTVLLAPVGELDKPVLLWYIRDGAKNRVAWFLLMSICCLTINVKGAP